MALIDNIQKSSIDTKALIEEKRKQDEIEAQAAQQSSQQQMTAAVAASNQIRKDDEQQRKNPLGEEGSDLPARQAEERDRPIRETAEEFLKAPKVGLNGLKRSDVITDNTKAIESIIQKDWNGYEPVTINGKMYYKDKNGEIHSVVGGKSNRSEIEGSDNNIYVGARYVQMPNGNYRAILSNGEVREVTPQQRRSIEYEGMSTRQQSIHDAADRAQEKFNELMDMKGGNVTKQDIEAIVGRDGIIAWNKVYGNKKDSIGAGIGLGDWGYMSNNVVDGLTSRYNEMAGGSADDAKFLGDILNKREKRDENGKLINGTPVTTLSDGTEIGRGDLEALKKILRKASTTDPHDYPLGMVRQMQTALNALLPEDKQIKVDDIHGTQTTGGILNLLDMIEPGSDAEKILKSAGVKEDEDGNLVLPKTPTADEIQSRLTKKGEAQDLRIKQREIERNKARLQFADFAAGIGDMIKASGGAVVTPRDYAQMYQSLDARTKANFDNYIARMDKLKADEKAERDKLRAEALRKAERQDDKDFQLQLAADQREHQLAMADKDFGYKKQLQTQAEKNSMDMLKEKLSAEKAIAADKLSVERAKASIQNGGKSPLLLPDGTKVVFGKGEEIPAKNALYGIIKKYSEMSPYLQNKINALDLQFDGYDSSTKASAIVDAILGSLYGQKADDGSSLLGDKMESEINSYLKNGGWPVVSKKEYESGIIIPEAKSEEDKLKEQEKESIVQPAESTSAGKIEIKNW